MQALDQTFDFDFESDALDLSSILEDTPMEEEFTFPETIEDLPDLVDLMEDEELDSLLESVAVVSGDKKQPKENHLTLNQNPAIQVMKPVPLNPVGNFPCPDFLYMERNKAKRRSSDFLQNLAKAPMDDLINYLFYITESPYAHQLIKETIQCCALDNRINRIYQSILHYFDQRGIHYYLTGVDIRPRYEVICLFYLLDWSEKGATMRLEPKVKSVPKFYNKDQMDYLIYGHHTRLEKYFYAVTSNKKLIEELSKSIKENRPAFFILNHAVVFNFIMHNYYSDFNPIRLN